MEIKYDAVFGPQELFDGMMGDCEFASEEYGYMFAKGALYYCERYNEKAGWSLSCKSNLTFKPSAMRRIIKEPKRWTWEDKREGLLPEVGCDIQYIESQKRVSVIAINSNEIVLLAKSNGSKFFVLDPDSLLQYYNPIETTTEKAKREEDEFVSGIVFEYDKMPSSVLFEAGIRAAYRKLKGGE